MKKHGNYFLGCVIYYPTPTPRPTTFYDQFHDRYTDNVVSILVQSRCHTEKQLGHSLWPIDLHLKQMKSAD